MKRLWVQLWHFLGGVHFAIVLIAFTASAVAVGTFLESREDSHGFAAHAVYGSWTFSALLMGFFVNILVSALRRWPFRRRHIPFLITHFGLLMVLSGILTKQFYGLQATLIVREGAATQQAFVRDSQSLEIRYRPEGNTEKTSYWDLLETGQALISAGEDTPPHLTITPKRYVAHSRERMEYWIKGSHAYIEGTAPFPVQEWFPGAEEASFELDLGEPWLLSAWRSTEEASSVLSELYCASCTVNGQNIDPSMLNLHLRENEALATLTALGQQIKLTGVDALISSPPLVIERPHHQLIFLEDVHGDQYVAAFDRHGLANIESFPQGGVESLWQLDNGFGGYLVESHVLPPQLPRSLGDRHAARDRYLTLLLRSGDQAQETLIPPLKMLQFATEKTQNDFAETTVSFLRWWADEGSWIIPSAAHVPNALSETLNAIEWKDIPPSITRALAWGSLLIPQINKQMKEGHHHPLLDQFGLDVTEVSTPEEALTTLLSKLLSVGPQLPEPPSSAQNVLTSAQWLSSYLAAFGVTPHSMSPQLREEQLWALLASDPENIPQITLQTPVTHHHLTLPPLNKFEDNRPLILLDLKDSRGHEQMPLTYDRFAAGPRWPALEGRYTVRFQPTYVELPHRIRLHDARQINRPSSQHPQAYEARITVTDTRNQHAKEVTLSMNHVHETWDGYRFYLSNITPPTETAVRQVQLVVNRDPLKYWLTYPGAIVLCIGALLLFLMRRYSPPKQDASQSSS